MVRHSLREEATKGGISRDEPVFTIGTVCRETGLHAATVRTWEDRYATIVPIRDRGGRRLYSQSQIDDLQWISEQVEGGLQPSEAHRLLGHRGRRTNGSDLGADLRSVEVGIGGEFIGWIADRSSWLTDVLDVVRSRVDGMFADLSANFHHPVFGLTRSTLIRSVDEARVGDMRLARFVGISWCELSDFKRSLALGETVSARYDDMDASAREVFGQADIRSILMVPIVVRGTWVGVVEVGTGAERDWSDDEVAVLEEAAEVISAGFTAFHVESGFGVRTSNLS